MILPVQPASTQPSSIFWTKLSSPSTAIAKSAPSITTTKIDARSMNCATPPANTKVQIRKLMNAIPQNIFLVDMVVLLQPY